MFCTAENVKAESEETFAIVSDMAMACEYIRYAYKNFRYDTQMV